MGHSRNAVYIFDDKSSDLPLWIQASRHEDAKSGQRVSCSIHTSASRNRNANRSLRHRCCRNSWIRLPVYYQQRVCNSSRKGGKEEWKFDPPVRKNRGILYILPRMKRDEMSRNSTRCSLLCPSRFTRKRRTVEVRVKRWWALYVKGWL